MFQTIRSVASRQRAVIRLPNTLLHRGREFLLVVVRNSMTRPDGAHDLAHRRARSMKLAAHAPGLSWGGWFMISTYLAGFANASWITKSAPFAYLTNHMFGVVSPAKTSFSPAYSIPKLTGPSPVWMAGQERTTMPLSS